MTRARAAAAKNIKNATGRKTVPLRHTWTRSVQVDAQMIEYRYEKGPSCGR